MERITVSIEPEHIALIDELSGDGGPCENRSESMRLVIDAYENDRELQSEVESLRAKLDESRRREKARDNTKQEIARIRSDMREQDAPFIVRWYRWYKSR